MFLNKCQSHQKKYVIPNLKQEVKKDLQIVFTSIFKQSPKVPQSEKVILRIKRHSWSKRPTAGPCIFVIALSLYGFHCMVVIIGHCIVVLVWLSLRRCHWKYSCHFVKLLNMYSSHYKIVWLYGCAGSLGRWAEACGGREGVEMAPIRGDQPTPACLTAHNLVTKYTYISYCGFCPEVK